LLREGAEGEAREPAALGGSASNEERKAR
jgi:hypothetical protein